MHLPGPDFVDRIWAPSNRNNRVLGNMQRLFSTGRLTGTGYLSILPVDQGIEHSRRREFREEPDLLRLREHREAGDRRRLQRRGLDVRRAGQSWRASTPTRFPFIVKINHNELLTYPNKADQIMFGEVEQAADMGAAAVGATIYFGSDESGRQIVEVAQAFALAHELGMATVLWCYLRNTAFKTDKDYHVSADLTGQANHLGVTIQADIIKQKLPENNGGFKALNTGSSSYGKLDERIYTELTSDHPIDLTRYQVVNCYMGRAGLINSGGASGKNDFGDAAVDGGHQQARGRHGPHLGPQGVPAADGRGREAAADDPGRVSRRGHHGGVAGGRGLGVGGRDWGSGIGQDSGRPPIPYPLVGDRQPPTPTRQSPNPQPPVSSPRSPSRSSCGRSPAPTA